MFSTPPGSFEYFRNMRDEMSYSRHVYDFSKVSDNFEHCQLSLPYFVNYSSRINRSLLLYLLSHEIQTFFLQIFKNYPAEMDRNLT